ncbi:MAG: acyltransferase domain-containing protein [Candidatus Levybacteria bacterium]|nr:acyltransferase domain-containing protein [Candidatus Levybacteria bacterium]
MNNEVIVDSRRKETEPVPGSVGYVFSGQGLSPRRILYDHFDALFAINPSVVKRNIQLMEKASGLPLSEYIKKSDEPVLDGTHVVQAMVHTAHLTAIELLGTRLSDPKQFDRTAGHSGGEIAAFVASGVITPEDSAKLIAKRGQAMHKASVNTKSGLIIPFKINRQQTESIVDNTRAVMEKYRSMSFPDVMQTDKDRKLLQLAAESEQISLEELWQRLQEDYVISLALVNEPDVNVIGGTETALVFARQIALENGVRRMLKVDAEGGFHTKAMREAANLFGLVFGQVAMQKSRLRVVLNNGIETTDQEYMRKAHIDRMTRPVNWVNAMKRFANIETVVKIGPGGQVPGITEANGISKERQVDIVNFLKG